MEIKRSKSLNNQFTGIQITENNLHHLATTIQQLAEKFAGAISIEVTSADGEDTIRTNNPAMFTSAEMPLHIRLVSIAYREYKSPISCSVELGDRLAHGARLVVHGEDPTLVSGTFHEISKQLSVRTAPHARFIKLIHSNSFWLHMIISLMLAAAVYATFDLPLRLVSSSIPGFNHSTLHQILIAIGSVATFAAFLMGGFYITEFTQATFPKVEFHGKLSDRNTGKRRILSWILVSIILPIVLNIISR